MLRLPVLTSVLLTCVTFSGCSTLPTSFWQGASNTVPSNQEIALESANTKPIIVASTTPTKVNIARTLSRAIKDLGKGNTLQAEEKLAAVLKQDPDNANALFFVEQLHVDPNEYFGKEFFEYKARRGDSMTSIAQRFTKNHLNFYILSRYSGFNDPSSLVLGQTLKIPASFREEDNGEEPQNTERVANSAHEDQLGKMLAEGRYLEIIELLSNNGNSQNSNRVQTILSEAYAGEAKRAEEIQDHKTALFLYQNASKSAVYQDRFKHDVIRVSNRIKAGDFLRLAKLYERSGQLNIALENVTKSLKIQPQSMEAKSLHFRVRSALAEGNDLSLSYVD